jgi:hypothetical protein
MIRIAWAYGQKSTADLPFASFNGQLIGALDHRFVSLLGDSFFLMSFFPLPAGRSLIKH